MNNKGSSNEQFFRFLLLALLASFLFSHYLSPQKPVGPPRKAPDLAAAFAGLDPTKGPAPSKIAALNEVTKLDKDIAANPQDELAYWSRLRKGLLQQYILGNLEEKTRKSGYFGFG